MGVFRLLLAVSVLLMIHSSPIFGVKMISGVGALQAFYAISGFYMALVLNEKYGTGWSGYGDFISQRFLRLMPTYYFCLILSFALGATGWGTTLPAFAYAPYQFWQDHFNDVAPFQKIYLIFSQLMILGQDWLTFMGVNATHGLFITRYPNSAIYPAGHFNFVMPAWSLGVELTFYLIAPLLVRRKWWIIGIVALCSVLIRATVHFAGHIPFTAEPWTHQFFPSELFFFLAGSLGYHFYATARKKGWKLRGAGWVAWCIVIGAMFFLPLTHWPARVFIFSLTCAPCVPFIFILTRKNAIDRWLGELSYPIYLVHAPVGALLARHMTIVPGWKLLLATIPTAIFIRICIELPIDRMRQRLHDRRISQAAALAPAPF